MTEVELRKLKRTELLELLVESEKERNALKIQVEKLEMQLASREIKLQEAGNIAQVAMEVNGVFEAAQAAAQQYLDNVKTMTERQEAVCAQKEQEVADRCAAMEQAVQERCTLMKDETQKACEELEAATKAACEELESTTKANCEQLEQTTKKKCDAAEKETEEKCLALTAKAEQDVEARWEDLSTRLEEFYKAHAGLRKLLTAAGGIQRD